MVMGRVALWRQCGGCDVSVCLYAVSVETNWKKKKHQKNLNETHEVTEEVNSKSSWNCTKDKNGRASKAGLVTIKISSCCVSNFYRHHTEHTAAGKHSRLFLGSWPSSRMQETRHKRVRVNEILLIPSLVSVLLIDSILYRLPHRFL